MKLGLKKIGLTQLKTFPCKYSFFANFSLVEEILLKGWGLTTPSFNRYKIAHTFETVLGMNKITPIPSPLPKKIFFILMIFLKNLFKGVGLATLSFNRYNMAQGLRRRSCFKYNEKTTPFPTTTFKKLKFFFCLTINL